MKQKLLNFTPFAITILFTILYGILALVKHNHFLSGYDLAIADQIVWKYSHFLSPITTVQTFAFTSLLTDHIEFIYILLAPFYWIYNSVTTLILLQVVAVTTSSIGIFLLAKKYNLSLFVSSVVQVSFLTFYGIQFALWSDVHSLVFAVGFLPWFIYFLETKYRKLSFLFFFLALLCKEDIALFTLTISIVHFVIKREKIALIFAAISLTYLGIVFGIYFPHFTHDGYRYANPHGMFTDISIKNFVDTKEKQQVLVYSFGWFGFLPLLAPLYLLTALADISHYFILGNAVAVASQGLFLHYRSSLALFLMWPTIIVLGKYKKFSTYAAVYLFFCAGSMQFILHLPLSYLTKSWFWKSPASVKNIQKIITYLPSDAFVVSQVNIEPHLTHRKNIVTLWPTTKNFLIDSPCGKLTCNWFRWSGSPTYLVVDTSTDWDARYWLTNRENFVDGLKNLENAKIIAPFVTVRTARLYKVLRNP